MKKNHTSHPKTLLSTCEWLIAGGVFLIPLVYSKGLLFAFSNLKASFLILLVAILLPLYTFLILRFGKRYLPRLSWTFVFLTLFVAWLLFTSLLGSDPEISFWSSFERASGLLVIVTSFLFSSIVMGIGGKENFSKKVFGALVFSGIVVTFSIYYALFFKASFFSRLTVGGGTIGNSSFAGAFMLFAVAGALWLIVKARTKIARIIWGVALFFLVVSPLFLNILPGKTGDTVGILGQARGACLGLLVGVAGSVAFLLSHNKKKHLRFLGIGLFAAGIIGSLLVSLSFFHEGSYLREKFVAAATPTRLLYGELALQGISTHPVIGWGWEMFPVVEEKYFSPKSLSQEYLTEGIVDKPHNVLLEIGVTSGIPGMIFYLGLFACLLVFASRGVRKGYFENSEGAVFFGVFIAYFLQNLFVFDMPAAYMGFYLFIGILMARYYHKKSENEAHEPLIKNPTLVTTITVFTALGACCAIWYFAITPLTESSRIQLFSHKSILERAAVIESNYAISPVGTIDSEVYIARRTYDAYIGGVKNLSKEQMKDALVELDAHLSVMEKDMERPYEDTRVYLMAARLAILSHLYGVLSGSLSDEELATLIDKADVYAHRAVALSPSNPQGYLPLSRVALVQDDYGTALKYAMMAVSLQPKYPESERVLLDILNLAKDKTAFNVAYARAREAIPNFVY